MVGQPRHVVDDIDDAPSRPPAGPPVSRTVEGNDPGAGATDQILVGVTVETTSRRAVTRDDRSPFRVTALGIGERSTGRQSDRRGRYHVVTLRRGPGSGEKRARLAKKLRQH